MTLKNVQYMSQYHEPSLYSQSPIRALTASCSLRIRPHRVYIQKYYYLKKLTSVESSWLLSRANASCRA